ncbi:DUF4936 family protein [Uliginosibacterium sp. H3]|uniref:DUF4936 family protein n=1 Tax=Uliginosibacterium silvisoli TaxID=3114758 RepID=A0ABU6K663_9RHOO|nr:DUF4936 family protein [Uliginosibacterium sp. H3]
MRVSFYVYYKLEATQDEAARLAVCRLFEALQHSEGITGRLSRRVDDPGTWMETYEGVTDRAGFRAALEAASERSGLSALLRGERHIEEFQEMDEPGSARLQPPPA